MAKTSSINRNEKVRKMVGRDAAKRAALKAAIMNRKADPAERFEAVLKLGEMPRNGAKIRIRNRCELTGRPHGTYRKFGLCRVMLREKGGQGLIPGLVKSSW
ncbi:30S ribosomal protein S14 [Alphaproteobacteria bacterium]|nr:30S ribosomal protein S14 [Alphaproteobacteria bacterium]